MASDFKGGGDGHYSGSLGVYKHDNKLIYVVIL